MSVAVLGFILAQGERDLVHGALGIAAALAALGSVAWTWSIVEASKRASEAKQPASFSAPLLVVASLVAFAGLPMLIGFIAALQSGEQLRVAELPWVFAFGLLLIALGVGARARS